MLDLRRLTVLRALGAEGTMTAAARSLYMTTSAVSQQIAGLERDVGLPLIVRTGRRVQLTEAGVELVAHAGDILARAEEAEAAMRRLRTDVAGTVTLAAFPSFCGLVVPDVVVDLTAAHPELRIEVSDLEPYRSVPELRAGRVDVAVVDDLNDLDTDGLVATPLAEDELVLCVRSADAGRLPDPVSIGDLADRRWLLDGSREVFSDYLTRLCATAGFAPDVVATCSTVSVTLALVEAGVGVALLSRMHAVRGAFDVAQLSLSPQSTRTVTVLTRASSADSPPVGTLVAALAQASLVVVPDPAASPTVQDR